MTSEEFYIDENDTLEGFGSKDVGRYNTRNGKFNNNVINNKKQSRITIKKLQGIGNKDGNNISNQEKEKIKEFFFKFVEN